MSASLACLVNPSRRKPLAACIATLFGLSASAAVHATATAIVTNCATSAATVGSLPWAATQAVNPGDIIDMTGISDFSLCLPIGFGEFAQTILLPSAVTVATGVTINGPNSSGSKVLAVSTGYADRVFYSHGYLTINNLGIVYATATTSTSGRGSSGGGVGDTVYGGCVFARSGLNISGVVLDHCTASATAANKNAKGGSIATYNGKVELANSTITHSLATSPVSGAALGGGLYAYGNVTLTGSYVVGTAATESGNAKGGGIAAGGAGGNTVSLTNSGVVVSYARASGSNVRADGGGIYSDGKVNLANSYVLYAGALHNAATGGRAAGGGVFAGQGVYLSGGSFIASCSANSASNAKAVGGGIYGHTGVSLLNSSVNLNQAGSTSGIAYGGGIYSVGPTSAHYSTLLDNHAAADSSTSEGGAIFSNDGVHFYYGTISGGQAQRGGGIAVAFGDLYLRGATLSNNYAKTAASALGMVAGDASFTATIVNSTISGNTVGSAGGNYAISIDAHSTKIYNSTIAYNTGGDKAGTFLTGAAGSTAGLYSTLMSSNSHSDGTQSDFAKSTNVTFTAGSSNNLIRHPGSAVPTGTLTGASACPLLHKLASNGGPTETHRLGGGVSKNPAIDTGSNHKSLGSDQRGGALFLATPARVSGGAADIGAYEVQQDDIIFDSEFETCPN